MAPKVARGRKKAAVKKMESFDLPAKETDSNGCSDIEASGAVEEKVQRTNASDGDKLNGMKTEELANGDGDSEVNGVSENDTTYLVAKVPKKAPRIMLPQQHGKKKANTLDENIDMPTETVDENAETFSANPERKVASNESPKSNTLDKDLAEDNGKAELDIKVNSGDKNNLEKQEVPLKRGRPRKLVAKPSEENIDEQISDDKNKLESKEVPLKRGRPRKNITKTTEESSEERVPLKRGRKKAEETNKEDSASVSEQEKHDVSAPIEEAIVPSKRGRRKGNQKDANEESNEGVKEHSEDLIKNEKSERNTRAVAANKNDKKKSEELSKKKNETSAGEIKKNKNNFDETKVLKVALQRSASIDKMFEEQTKVTETGGSKNVKTGSKRAKGDDADSQAGTKSPKIPKGESKSKGQSKKDKMPDVTLLDFSNNSTSPSGKTWNLKISSWNVNGVRAWLEKDGLAYITHENPDIMAFQETKCSDKMLPSEVNITGYHSYWLAGDKDGYSGVGLLSKKEPISVKYGIGIEEHDNEGRVITAEYETFYLVTTYVPNAGRGLVRLSYRMQWDKDFRSYLKNLDENKPVVLCGDLNVAHEEIDLANPKSNKKNAGFTKEEREGFSTLLSEGFIDSFRHLYPNEMGAYTFWTYMSNARAKNVGWRLDYFVLSKKFTDHLCDSAIRKDVFGSDHCPITLFLYV